MPLRVLPVLLSLISLTACIPPGNESTAPDVPIDLADPLTQRIYDLQNERNFDSLLVYLADERPTVRYLAARAFGSFPTLDARVLDSLLSVLNDPSPAVRTQAAYALGQSGEKSVVTRLVASFDPSGKQPQFNAAVLQAAGKLADAETARNLASISTYTAEDTTLMAGRAWAIYYAALGGNRSPQSDAEMLELVTDASLAREIRYPAAFYLYRIDFPVDSLREPDLRAALRRTKDPVLAMGLIRTLGRSGLGPARVALLRRLEQRGDWRERVEVIRAFAGYDYAAVRESVIEALRDPHPLVALTAADFLLAHGIEADAPLYLQLAEDPLPNPVLIRLYRAANRHLSPYLTDYRERIVGELRNVHDTSTEPYERADVLRALSESPWMFRVIYTYFGATDSPVERTAAAEALQLISGRQDFEAVFRASSGRVRGELSEYFKAMITTREEGPAYHSAQALVEQTEAYRAAYATLSWLDSALLSFELPRQLETYREVSKAASALNGDNLPAASAPPTAVRAIDWDLLAGAAEKQAVITTAEGEIVLELYPEAAPATVSSFLELIGRGYYDGRAFHRVVPNFVAQGGGPRGDGFGSEDFIVRTETPMLHWDRVGLVGMASAGKDTEGVQFFITHSPTPHLDGKYTIFAGVIEGQEVVDRLVPGSKIIRITTR
ncbi:cyclophilin family peptidyl-prolyl cis-trans isomerase/HEAT repeat protein [Lewinella aquimaris]|uniref:peptidylprolyl isomerase n=1 Tax=Neolewinella aquimaris TaxID=1835722 RepID=A0A840E9H7_9BACT|nr:peptidylprolyl isomerase [Neolewinella aquimaris]MBB4078459.1 cyclophilin family peptidyl-prolyl cis-trans isomerase/HEAT repeat protein [Neolewinella aquimaris]